MQDRVPVTAAHTRGIIDPVSALLMPTQGRGEPLDPDNCNRTLPVFDGATRFNVVLSYAELPARSRSPAMSVRSWWATDRLSGGGGPPGRTGPG